MKNLSQASKKAVENMGNISNLPAVHQDTSSHGLIKTDGKTTTAIARSRQENIADQKQVAKAIRWTQSVSLWRIKQDDPKTEQAVFYVENLLTPITYEEAVIEMGRFLQHYPRRESSKDGVVIQDLAEEFESQDLGIGIIVMALRSIRNEYREGNPWSPQTGYILKKIREKQKSYKEHHNRLTTPPRIAIEKQVEEVKETPRKWEYMHEDLRKYHLEFMNELDMRIRKSYMRALGIPESALDIEA